MRESPLSRRLRRAVHRALGAAGVALGRHPVHGGFRLRRLPRLGRDMAADVRRILGGPPRTVFDVGANTGQSALVYLHDFPGAAIHSFEPDPAAFAALRENLRPYPRAACHDLALGDAEGPASFYRSAFGQMNSLLPTAPAAGEHVDPSFVAPRGETVVQRTTLDRFRAEHGIGRIDLLKADVQGYELHVLRGAAEALRAGAIGLVYLEVHFVPAYEGQPSFSALLDFLLGYGYRLVGLYEAGYAPAGYLTEANALFVSDRVGVR
ncbi:MAG TPA: FkbM family methyltransferase [Longimicrobium sp.]|nr:FkbM family methyltransferase [Longimicrobium sp.]